MTNQLGLFNVVVTLALSTPATAVAAARQEGACGAPATASIPWSQLSAKVGADHQGDGLAVVPSAAGGRLRCVFQRLEGEATRQGLWLTSTVSNAASNRFRVTAVAVGRAEAFGLRRQSAAATPVFKGERRGEATLSSETESGVALRFPPQSKTLARTGTVEVADQRVRFVRPGVTEEYSVSLDGVRQDFVVQAPPLDAEHSTLNIQHSTLNRRAAALRVELDVTGARAEETAFGAQLVLESSGRRIAYGRLRVTDAMGRELPARMAVASGILPDVEGAHPAARKPVGEFLTASWSDTLESAGLEAPALRQAGMPGTTLAVVVNDAEAVYPVRIDPTFSDANWMSMGGIAGTDGNLNAAVVDDAGNLYIGGSFIAAGDVTANGIAKWNGSSWSALGPGMSDGGVSALAVSGSNLYAGGRFTMAGGIAATNIAKWNGSSWSALGSGISDGGVSALAVSGTDVYAGGWWFTTAGGSPATNIAKWNGSSWSALGSGISDGGVSALAVSGTDVYAAGQFTTAGGSPATNIAKWNGTSWSALGSGLPGAPGPWFSGVLDLAASGSDVYAGGWFRTADGSPADHIAKWDGSNWSAVGRGIDSAVTVLAVSGSNVYAGGRFTAAGGSPANHIAKWNGSDWTALGTGMSGDSPYVYRLAVSDGDVYVAGGFTTVGGSPATNIAKWNGSGWSPLGSGINGELDALAVLGNDLYLGGWFRTAGGSPATNIAKWNGSSWSALGSGVNAGVYALAVSGGDLYALGEFTTAGGNAATNIAKWNGSSWSALGSGISGGGVRALAVSGTDVYAGGWFTTAGGSPATNIAKWNGSSWSALGSGISGGDVRALAVSGTDVYAGGWFTTAGGSPATNIAKWNGSSWSALGSWMSDVGVSALAVSGTDVYAGGPFTTAGGSPANYIAKWNGSSWTALGSGVNRYVYALTVSGSELYVGGGFTTAGGKVSACVARAYVLPLPTLSVRRSGLGVLVSWPSADTADFVLEQAGTLTAPASWFSNTASVTDDGTNESVTVPATNPAQFFRLRRP